MTPLQKEVKLQIEITPKELSEMFWNMRSDEQAEFFNELSEIDLNQFSIQMRHVSESRFLNESGRKVMKIISSTESEIHNQTPSNRELYNKMDGFLGCF